MKTNYQNAKENLKNHAVQAKKIFKTDKPAQRQYINDYTDMLCKDYHLTEYQRDLLYNYSIKFHPKN